jgi:hypothetical protein
MNQKGVTKPIADNQVSLLHTVCSVTKVLDVELPQMKKPSLTHSFLDSIDLSLVPIAAVFIEPQELQAFHFVFVFETKVS